MEKRSVSKKLFTVVETGKILGISRVKVYELIKHRLLKAMNLAGFKIAAVEIDRFIDTYNGKDLTNLDDITDLKVEDIKSAS